MSIHVDSMHQVRYVLDNDVDDLGLDFSDAVHDSAAGCNQHISTARVDLIPGGSDIEVTNANKAEFVRLVCEWRLFGSIREQCRAMCRGFHVAIPRHIVAQLAQLIQPSDLTRLLAGEPRIDVHDWEKNCSCAGGMKRSDKVAACSELIPCHLSSVSLTQLGRGLLFPYSPQHIIFMCYFGTKLCPSASCLAGIPLVLARCSFLYRD